MRCNRRQCLLSLASLLFAGGCLRDRHSSGASMEVSDLLAKPRATTNSMALEFATVSVVPYRQRLLQDTWNQVDQQAIDLATRKTLVRNGIRAGIAGQAIPPALRSLMKPRVIDRSTLSDVQKEMLDQGVLEPQGVIHSHTRLTVQPNRSRDLPIVSQRPELVWRWQSDQGTQFHHLTQAASLLRVTMSPLSGNAVSIGTLPLVKHGKHQPQFSALEDQLALQIDQTERLLSEARLSCHLRCGETLVIGPADGRQPQSTDDTRLGHVFFSAGPPENCQTLVLLRLLDSNTTEVFS